MKFLSMPRNRLQAGGAYLAITLAVVAVLFALVYFVYYPWGLFETLGGLELFFITAALVIIIGPALVTIIYKPGKKGLAFDLVVIPILQVAALAYGLHVLYLSRPAYVVFVKDRFEMVRANEISEEEAAKAGRFPVPTFGPHLAAARLPKDPKEIMALMFGWANGVDVQHFPRYYVDYAEARGDVRAKAKPLAELRKLNPGRDAYVDSVVRDTGRAEPDIAWLPLKGDKRELAAFVDARSGEFLRAAPLKPWD